MIGKLPNSTSGLMVAHCKRGFNPPSRPVAHCLLFGLLLFSAGCRRDMFQQPFEKPLEKSDVHLVSFSVDPEKDTPAVLRGYAGQLQAEAGRWDFLTGPKSAIYKLSHDGFKLAVSDGNDAQRLPVHSTRMVLVDRRGQIRGYYDATEAEAFTKLLADTNHLLREQPK